MPSHHHVSQHPPGVEEHGVGRLVKSAVGHVADVRFVLTGNDDHMFVSSYDGLVAVLIGIFIRHPTDHVADHRFILGDVWWLKSHQPILG